MNSRPVERYVFKGAGNSGKGSPAINPGGHAEGNSSSTKAGWVDAEAFVIFALTF